MNRSRRDVMSSRFARLDSVVQMHSAVAETVLIQQFKLQTDIVGQGLRAGSHHDGGEEQVKLVDQPGLQCMGSKRRTAR